MNKSRMNRSSTSKKESEKKIIYSARFVKENFGDRFIVRPLQTFTKEWTFRNNGETEWPADTLFIQTNGDELQATSQIIQGPIKPGMEVTVSIELVAPKLPGKYCAFFRFVHGDNHRFGQKVWCDILVQEEEMIKANSPIASVKSNVGSGVHSQEERSSLLNESDSQQISQNTGELQSLQFDKLGEQYEELQKQIEKVEVDERSELKKTINNLMSDFNDPVDGLNTSQIEEVVQEQMNDFQEEKSLNNNVSEVVEDHKVEDKEGDQEEQKVAAEDLKVSQHELTFAEREKLAYLEEMKNANIKDQAMIQNLEYMMETGFTNFKINHSLLKRNNNDLAVAMNLLCNGIVSDSMFQ